LSCFVVSPQVGYGLGELEDQGGGEAAAAAGNGGGGGGSSLVEVDFFDQF
jgi:hypothetical protein